VKIKVISVAGKMPAWVTEGVADYEKRLPREFKLEWLTLPLATRRKDRSTDQLKKEEGDAILRQVKEADTVVALDVRGKRASSEKLSEMLQGWQAARADLTILIGGPDGLDRACLERANALLSLSELTLPHALVRVVLAEQLYRAWSISVGHPYHRA
jgi:23S rRNA (pseudouridine1915-N3)-methyltransferase